MSRNWTAAVAIGLSLTLAACGGSSTEEAAKKMQEGAKQMEKGAQEMAKAAEKNGGSAEDMAKGFESMAKGLTAMAGGDPNAKPVDPVSFRDLMSVFPESFKDWERSKPTGEKMSSPVNYSEAKVRFTKGDARLELQITDSGFNQLLIAPFSMFLTAGYEKETEDGYEKSTKVGDFPGWEKWNSKGKNGELNVIVNKRFMVQVEGNNVDDAKMMHEVMAAINLKKLGELKSDAPAAK